MTIVKDIIANSTFSWWGAWLNNNMSRRIVAPKKWFTSTSHCSSDIVPGRWLQI